MNMSRQMVKMLDWYLYNGEIKPTESISDARWKAIIKFIKLHLL